MMSLPFRTIAVLALAIGLSLQSPIAGAADRATADPAAAAPSVAEGELLAAFGGPAGLLRLTSRLVALARDDARIGRFFADVNPPHLSQQLADQFCALLGGPCVYDGAPMKDAHADMGIARNDFLALVELLQQAMAEQGVAFGAQNRLLARLAPMHRDIVSR